MADPATLSLVAGGVGALTSAGGGILGGIATSEAANYQAEVAQNNATIAKQNAAYAIQAGEAKATATSLKSAATEGAIKAAEASGNIDVNSGSAADVQESQRELGELDTMTVMNNAALQAYGFQSEATGFEAQAGLEEAEASEAPIAGALSGAGSLLSSASSLGFKFTGAQPAAASPTSGITGDY